MLFLLPPKQKLASIFIMDTDPYIFTRFTGGIGNRLFQLYAAKQYSQVNNLPLKIVRSLCAPDHGKIDDFYNLFPDVPMLESKPDSYDTVLQGKDDSSVYTYVPFEQSPALTHVYLSGMWQAYKYCENVNLTPNWENALKGHEVLGTNPDKNRWMIHFRHGDYKFLDHHNISLVKYYTKCLYAVPPGSHIRAFSDEPELSKDLLESIVEGRDITVSWSNEMNDIAALYEMSNCLGGLITANSTFSWWGAFFAKKRADELNHKMNVYYPAQYLTKVPDSSHLVPDWGTKVLLY